MTDMVEVVRCKDCRWWEDNNSSPWTDEGKQGNCRVWGFLLSEEVDNIFTEANDYCSNAIKR